MKHGISIITGIFLGVIVSSVLIYIDKMPTSYGADSALDKSIQAEHPGEWINDDHWHKTVTDAMQKWTDWEDNFKRDSSWKSVFGDLKNKVPNLYYFVVGKVENQPHKKAIEIIAQNYALDFKSAEAAVNGSLTALMKSKKVNTARSYNDASALLIQVKKDYDEYKELFDIQSSLELSVGPLEIFANGNIQDSGFDLIQDLTDIEKILFKDTTKPSVGGPWELSLDSPYVQEPGDVIGESPSGAPPVAPPSPTDVSQPVSPIKVSEDKKSATFKIGDQEVAAEVLAEDICPTPDPVKAATDNFDKENPNKKKPLAQKNGEGPGSVPGGGEGGGAVPLEKSDNGTPIAPEEGIPPAPAHDYASSFCSNVVPPDNGSASDANFSIGSIAGGASTGGASYGVNKPGMALKVGICISLDLVWKTVSSYNASDSCIKCEIEKMNEIFTKFLAHGLGPGKTTGNIFESPTCKKTLISIDMIDMKFMAIGNPIPIPKGDDATFGGNAAVEWNKYVQKQSGWWNDAETQKSDTSQTLEYSVNYASPNSGYDEIVTNLQMEVAQHMAEVGGEVEAAKIADKAAQIGLLSKSLISEFNQMKEFFIKYKDTFQKDIYKKGCQEAIKKEACS